MTSEMETKAPLPKNELNKGSVDVETKPTEGFGENEEDMDLGVLASVPTTDEDVPASTFRSWMLGILFTMITNGLNQLFTMHNPPLVVSVYVVILITYPLGCFLARVLPERQIHCFGTVFTLNPGPFNHKEHTLISIMIVGTSTFNSNATAADVYTTFIKYLGMAEKVTIGYKLMFLLASQAFAFGLGGVFQRLVVDPAYCVWPSVLPICALLHGFHNGSFSNFSVPGWNMPRMRFFWIILVSTTAYQFIPGYLFTALSTFAWVTWIAPNNVVINHIFGSTTGLDLIPITFDWNQATAYLSSPLVVPGWAILNLGFVVLGILWVITPALHWSNTWYGLYLPISSSSIFDNTGASYNVTKVINPDFTLNDEAYHAYSPIFLSTTSILSYGLGLGSVTAVLVHSYLNHHKQMWQGLKATFNKGSDELEREDVHTRLMKRYKSTPTWWYFVSLISVVGLSIGFVEGFNTGVPWWGILLALAIQLATIVPMSIMAALCNQTVSLNVIAGLLGGFLFPGNMEAVIVFKVFLYIPLETAVVLLRDQKLGHYMKVPPRVVFSAQAIGIIVSWLTQTGVNTWALNNISGICTTSTVYICPIARAFESSIITWGLIGPARLFGAGSMYSSMLYILLVGAALPVIVYLTSKKFPRSWIKHIHVPLIMSSTASIPPATAINFIPWALIGLIFNWIIKRRSNGWWLKYNYLLSAGLDGGLGICTFLIFFCLYYPGVTLNWWGNVGALETADVMGLPVRSVSLGETFGPSTWR